MNAMYDRDADPELLARKTIAIVGYGSQGRAHARNLRDSGHHVIAALRDGSPSKSLAAEDGVPSESIEHAVTRADIVMILAPDEEQPAIFIRSIAPHLRPGAYLGFAHGFAVHFGTIVPPPNVNIFMCAPKGPGRLVRSEYEAGRGVPSLICVQQDPAGDTRAIALAYASAIGSGRAGILETTFKEECETDLFGEQAVLCGGLPALVRAGYETLTEAGYAPEMAYFEILHEVKLIADLMYERGIEGMRDSISNTAKYGGYTRGERIVTSDTKRTMKQILSEIQDGTFARQWVAEHAAGKPIFSEFRTKNAVHPIEAVGRQVRGLLPWLRANATKPSPMRVSAEDE